MASKSNIEWTDSTWNPIAGCSVVSPGCTNCYAMRTAARLAANPQTPHYHGTVQSSKAGPVWTGKIGIAPDRVLTAPLRWRNPRRIFVNSMGDLFHESIPDEWIDKVFAVMALRPDHTFQVLTKRAERMRAYFDRDDRDYTIGAALGNMLDGDWIWNEGKKFRKAIEDLISAAHGEPVEEGEYPVDLLPLPKLWLGVSCERQEEADERIPHLLQTPAAVRFVSAEPLLGPIDFTNVRHQLAGESFEVSSALHGDDGFGLNARRERLDWIIIGGESGKDPRPFDIDWGRSILRQCKIAGVRAFMKQLGANPYSDGRPMHAAPSGKYGDPAEWPPELRVREFPRVAA